MSPLSDTDIDIYGERMSGIVPYLHLPGTARAALNFYAQTFGASTEMHTFADFGRTDGSPEAIAHGELVGGPVNLYVADTAHGQGGFRAEGLMLALLGAADPDTLTRWFEELAAEGTVVDQLQQRQWGASDGQVIDRFGIHWLVGFQHSITDEGNV
jgi:PhnB protein